MVLCDMKKLSGLHIFTIAFSSIMLVLVLTSPCLVIRQYTTYNDVDFLETYRISFFGFWNKKGEVLTGDSNAEYPGYIPFERGSYQDFLINVKPFPYYSTILILSGFLLFIIGSLLSILDQRKKTLWIRLLLYFIGIILPFIGFLFMLFFGLDLSERFFEKIIQNAAEMPFDYGLTFRFGWGFALVIFGAIGNFFLLFMLILDLLISKDENLSMEQITEKNLATIS